jgi:succinoglycan biosynthesis transport protein ExoP
VELLRRRRGAALVLFLVFPVVALVISVTSEKRYTATSSLLFRDPQFDQKLFGSTFIAPTQDAAREGATNIRLVSLRVVADRTARRMGGGLTGADIAGKVQVEAAGSSDVASVEATDPSPRRAVRIADVFASQYVAFRRDADRAKIGQAQRLVQAQYARMPIDQQRSSQGQELLTRSDQLEVLASLQTGNAEVVQHAELPTSPSSPRTARNIVGGLILGAFAAVFGALAIERLDRRVREPHELEAIMDRPILAVISESRSLAKSRSSVEPLSRGEREAFRMLRANLRYFNVDHDVRSVLVTSAAPGDGKTTVAWNLAITAAEAEGRVLLIEADLRHPGIAQGLGMRSARGLSTVLSGEASLDDVIQEAPLPEAHGGRVRTVEVLLSGPLPPNPSDLVESERMRALIAAAERQYDLVVIDTPPMAVVSDAIPLIRDVGGVIVVGRLGKTTRHVAERLKEQLDNLRAPVLGVVVNGLKHGSDGYGYGYGETYGEQFESPSRDALRA